MPWYETGGALSAGLRPQPRSRGPAHASQRYSLHSGHLPTRISENTLKILKFHGAGPTTLRGALARHADVLAPVHRGALDALAAFATDPQQAARLRRLASPDGRADFQAWAAAPGRTLLEAMQEFPSARPPLGQVHKP